MALFDNFKNNISSGLVGFAGYDPNAPMTEQERQQRQNQGLQDLAQRLSIRAAQRSGDPSRMGQVQQRLVTQQAVKDKRIQDEKFKQFLKSPQGQQYQGMVDLLGVDTARTAVAKNMGSGTFEGTSLDAQYLNILEQGKNSPEVRNSTTYKVAYNQLTKPKTSTYINESGQPVTRTVPGLDPSIYPTPTSTETVEPPLTSTDASTETTSASTETTTDDGGITETVGISAERRKLLEKDIDIVDGVVNVLNNLEEVILRVDPGVLTFGKDLAEVDSAYNSVLLELKNYAELGVLAGPDLDLLENWIGNPTSIKQLLKDGNKGTLLQLRQLRAAALKNKNKGLKELGQDPVEVQTQTQPKKYYKNGKEIVVSQDGSQWVYKDDGTPAQ
tara:strand:- start:8 stop:1165 length:1158 start_codon:yes stop_codon:yes gene_type:complete